MNKTELLDMLQKNKNKKFLYFEHSMAVPLLILPALYTEKQLDSIFQDKNSNYRYKMVNGTLAGEKVLQIYKYK